MKTLKEVLGNNWIEYFTRKETIENLLRTINNGHQKFVGVESIKKVNNDRISVIFSTIKDGHSNRGYNLLDIILDEPTWEQMMDITFGIGHRCDIRIVVYDKAAELGDKISNRATAVGFAGINNSCGVATYILAADLNGDHQSDGLDIRYEVDADPACSRVTAYRRLPTRREFEEAEFWLRFDNSFFGIGEVTSDPDYWINNPVHFDLNNNINVIPNWTEDGFYVEITTDCFSGQHFLLSLLQHRRSDIEQHFSGKDVQIHRLPDIPVKIAVKFDDRPFSEFVSMGINDKNEYGSRYWRIVCEFHDFFEDLIADLKEA
ncbi:MAG: hypothetical protein P8X85_25445 [Desulfobacterales bacterium]